MSKSVIIGVLVVVVAGLAYQLWMPTASAPVISRAEQTEQGAEKKVVCAQVITPARDPKTNEITEFPTPCDVPDDWEVIQNDVPGLDLEVQ